MVEPAERRPEATRVFLGDQGQLEIPAAFRQAMGIRPGDPVVMRLDEDGSLRVRTLDQALERARAILRRYVPPEVSLVDELIAERRAEAARE